MDIGPNPRDDLIFKLRHYMIRGDAAQVLDDDPPLMNLCGVC